MSADQICFYWGALCVGALAYIHFLTVQNPDRNWFTRQVAKMLSEKYSTEVISDPRKKAMTAAVLYVALSLGMLGVAIWKTVK